MRRESVTEFALRCCGKARQRRATRGALDWQKERASPVRTGPAGESRRREVYCVITDSGPPPTTAALLSAAVLFNFPAFTPDSVIANCEMVPASALPT